MIAVTIRTAPDLSIWLATDTGANADGTPQHWACSRDAHGNALLSGNDGEDLIYIIATHSWKHSWITVVYQPVDSPIYQKAITVDQCSMSVAIEINNAIADVIAQCYAAQRT